MYQEDQRNPARLQPEFWAAYQRALELARNRGITMKPYCMERSIYEQARLWRQSRSTAEVQTRLRLLESKGAKFMAHVLNAVGPQAGAAGRHVTWVTLGWHQFGEAVDAFWERNGKACWSTSTDGAKNGYKVFRECARAVGLNHLRGDYPHIQLRTGAPLNFMSYTEADELMQIRYGSPTAPTPFRITDGDKFGTGLY